MLFRHGVRAARGCPAARCTARSSRMAAATCRPRLWSSAVSASGSNPSVAQRTLGWLFTGGAVAAACGLANHVCDNPVFCQLAVELAQRDPRVAAAAGGAVSAKWWGYAWSGTVFHNRAAVTIPLIVTGGSASTNCYIRGKAIGEGSSAQNWQFIFLEVVVERQPTAETGHDGRPITTTIDLMRDEEGDDAADNPSAGSFAIRKGAAGHGHGHGHLNSSRNASDGKIVSV